MFEDALIESSHCIRSRSGYWSLPALLVNCAALCALIVWPLLHPEALPRQVIAALLIAPPALPTPAPVSPAKTQGRSTSLVTLVNAFQAPSRISQIIERLGQAAMPDTPTGIGSLNNVAGMKPGDGLDGILNGTGHAAVVKAEPPAKVKVSSGVMAGRLMQKVMPQYPAMAKATHTQGTVVLLAFIARNGAIENLRVLSGPPMLQRAAIDAVRLWRYEPYQLNGQPVEVETTINVVFNLGGLSID
jgi:protein TonB